MRRLVREIPAWTLAAILALAFLAMQATLDRRDNQGDESCVTVTRPGTHGALRTSSRASCERPAPHLTA